MQLKLKKSNQDFGKLRLQKNKILNSFFLLVVFMKKEKRKWIHQEKVYFLFQSSELDYLYYTNDSGSFKGLITGKHFEKRIEELAANPESCIECGLADLYISGVSLDGGNLLEFGLTSKEANDFLEKQIF